MSIAFGSPEAQAILESEPELLPCPFCGGKADMIDRGENEHPDWRYQIYCPDYQVYAEKDNRAAAIAHWNKREPLP